MQMAAGMVPAIVRDSHQRAMEKALVAYLKARQEGDD
jgi:hypothetical protein